MRILTAKSSSRQKDLLLLRQEKPCVLESRLLGIFVVAFVFSKRVNVGKSTRLCFVHVARKPQVPK